CTAAPIVTDGQPSGEVLTFQDISERKRSEQRRGTRHKITRILSEASDLKEAAAEILSSLCEGLGWDAGTLWLVDRAAGVLRCAELWHAPQRQLGEFGPATRSARFYPGV